MKRLISYASKRFKSLRNSLKSYHQVEHPEVLHLIRLELKKVKAILNLLQYGSKKFNAHKHFVPFRTIFRRAGEIRQPEVTYRLLLKYQIEGVEDARIAGASQLELLTSAFRKEVATFTASTLAEKKRIKRFIKGLARKDALKYISRKKKQLKRLLFPDFQPTTLHKTRKIIKEIIFLQRLDKRKESIAFFERAEDIIGQWHDKQAVLQILKNSQLADQAPILMAASQQDLANLRKTIHTFYSKGEGMKE